MAGSTHISSDAVASGFPTKQVAEDPAKTDLWIFREGRREVSGPAMLRGLQHRLSARGELLDCLIEAGELEAALADCGAAAGVRAASLLTDALAYEVCTGNRDSDPAQLTRRIETPNAIRISPPEGFTYYAMHPIDFASVVKQIPDEPKACAVVGIRSIGTTLSAMTTAALRADGRAASRITVRPTGHPYARNTQFTDDQTRWIRQQISLPVQFLIVDEGPGRSGSTFLSVAEALRRAGVDAGRITIIGSRQFDPEGLCAENAAERWRTFRFISTMPSVSSRFSNCLYLGGGYWRMHVCDREQDWPESWTQMERLKFLSPDRREFFKFEGMGPIGSEVRERAFVLAAAGFSPAVSDAGDGFLSYAASTGNHLRKEDTSTSLLEFVARYCAFRSAEFSCTQSSSSELEQMLSFNVQQEFGRELELEPGLLSGARSVRVDGRMQPHEWVSVGDDKFFKTDAISHGDNHFFPGPCDIAWDLAGAVVEWELGSAALEFLLAKFGQYSGMDVSPQLPSYILAYCVFRLGFCKMARSTVPGSNEEYRLDLAYRRYRNQAEGLLESSAFWH